MPKNQKNKITKHRFKKLLAKSANSPLPEVAFFASFVMSRWWLNSDFSYPVEIIIPIILFGVLGATCFYIFKRLLGDEFAGHLSALLLGYGFYGYAFVSSSIVGKYIMAILPKQIASEFNKSIWLALWMVAAAYGIGRLFKYWTKRFEVVRNLQLYKVLLFAILFMFSTQLFRFCTRVVDMQPELNYKASALNVSSSSKAVKGKPDIYYLLFDRYTNAQVLKNNFNYDNTDLMDYLSSNGFVNRPQAYSNYPFTMSSVSSTVSMNYLTNFRKFDKTGWQATFPYRTILNDPPVAQILKRNGYKYNEVSSWWDFTRLRVKADDDPAKSFRLNLVGARFYLSDLQRDILNKSILSPWLKKGLSVGDFKLAEYDLDRNPRENFEKQMTVISNIASRPDRTKPNYTFAHILAPHPPYVFAADGSEPSYDKEANDNGVDEAVKYKSELTYVNAQIKNLVGKIKQYSPDAVIILQADEGPYPKQFRGDITQTNFYDPNKLPDYLIKQKFGTLASYYMPGVSDDDISGIGSSVNAFRLVLNNYIGYDLKMLPECHYSMGNKFSIYNYQEISPRLVSRAAPAECAKY